MYEWLSRCERRRRILAGRERNYDRLRQRLVDFRANNDPEERAKQYLDTAQKCELAGEFEAARGYYELAFQISHDQVVIQLARAGAAMVATETDAERRLP
jgi:hypothetical protein